MKMTDKLLILIFIIFIFTPCVGLFFKKDPSQIRAQLNRDPYYFPGINIKRIGRTDFKGIENWFADQALLIHSFSKLWSNFNYYLGKSAKPEQVIVGKQGWLFLGDFYNKTLSQYLGKNLPTKQEMTRMLDAFKQMNRHAQENNIPFLVVIAPDKQDIYSEYLPDYIKKSTHLNRHDRLNEGLRAHKIDFIDLRAMEVKAKDTLGKQYGELYFKCDSHWNFLGASIANQAIIDYLAKKNIVVPNKEYTFLPKTSYSGDLAAMLQIDRCKSNASIPDISSLDFDLWGKDENSSTKLGPFEGVANGNGLKTPYEITNKALNNKLTCLLMGDSFSEALGFYFHTYFYRTVRVHIGNRQYKFAELVKKYHPDVIVFEIVERQLHGYPWF